MTLAVFVAALAIIVAVGLASARKSRGTSEDYYLASRSVSPMLVGLSAVATNNSGYMFIGVIGFTYTTGLSAIWLMIGWIIGDFMASLYVHKHLRIQAERSNDATFGGVLSRWGGVDHRHIRRLAAILTILFLGAYAAAQLTAGGKALHAVFGWDERSGALMAAIMVAAYCLAGGIRASIWTDAVQSIVMLVSMALLLIAAVAALGGINAAWSAMDAIPGYLNYFPQTLLLPGPLGAVLFVLGWIFAGVSVVGQPHIMVRFMALDKPDQMTHARIYYYSFFTIFYAMATGVGLLSRLYLPDLGSVDPELALPTMAQELLHPAFVGLILAGIFAATMSTADSLVLSCSAALTHDLAPQKYETKNAIKAATLGVTLLALIIAVMQPASVFNLVILSWSTLASAFAPLLVVYAIGRRLSEKVALSMMIIGPLVAFGWRQLGWHESIYEGMPGILSGFVVYMISNWVTTRVAKSA